MKKDPKDPGVLYVRYDKNSPCGQLIERLKQENKYSLNQKILELLFLIEIPEALDTLAFDLDEYSDNCYKSLKFLNNKLALVRYRIDVLAKKNVVKHRINKKDAVSSVFDRK